MAQSVDRPIFYLGNPARVFDHRAFISGARFGAAMLRLLRGVLESGTRRGDDHIGVGRMHRNIGGAMKYNRANMGTVLSTRRRRVALTNRGWTAAPVHGGIGGWQVGCGSIGQSGMNAGCGVKFGIGGAHNRRHGAAGGKTRHIDSPGVDLELLYYGARHPGDDAWLPLAA